MSLSFSILDWVKYQKAIKQSIVKKTAYLTIILYCCYCCYNFYDYLAKNGYLKLIFQIFYSFFV